MSSQTEWFPVATLVIGFLTKSLTDLLQDRRTAEREKNARLHARKEANCDRRWTFQRETLLALQESLMELARVTAEVHSSREEAFDKVGSWVKVIPSEVAEAARQCRSRTTMLIVRVEDDQVRHLGQRFRGASTEVMIAQSKDSAIQHMMAMLNEFETVNKRIGELLRSLDKEIEAATK
jgi:hypothetical protein